MNTSRLPAYSTKELLEELERRNFKLAVKIVGVDVICMIGDKEYEVTAI